MSNTAQYNRGVPGVPLAALDAIQDQNTRQVLRAIVDGWHVRNGASGNGDGRFVTQGELGSSMGYRLIGGLSNNYQSSTDSVDKLSASDINRLITELQASVMTSQLWQELGERVKLIDLSLMIEQNARIEAVQAVADKLKYEETARIAAVKKVADDLTTETTTRVTAVNKVANDLTKVASDLAAEATTRLNFDNVSGSRISSLESTTGTQATQISGLTTRIGNAENTIVSINNTNASQASTLNSLTTRIGSSESSITTLNTTTASQASSITSLSNRVGSAESSITNLNKASSDQATSLTSLTTRVSGAESNITTLNSTTSSQASAISALSTRVGTSESNITNLNKTTSDQATSLTSLTTRVGTTESKITTLQLSDASQASTLSSLTTKMASAESSISTLNTTTTAQASSITSLTTKVSAAENNITNITKTTADHATALASLTTRVGSAESSITALNTTTSTQATTLNSLSTRVGTAESTISTLNTTTANQANSLTLLSTTINKKNRTFIQGTAPVSTSDYTLRTGDLWFNTADKNKAYQWDGSRWLECSDGRIAESVGAISSEATTRANADNALTTLINSQVSSINNSLSALQTTTTTLSNSVSSLTSQATTLQSTVNGQTSALSQEITTRVDTDNWLLSKWEVKTDINGYISGFGLAQDAKQNSTPYSRFIVRADQFAIGSPNGPGITAAVPFVVQTTPTTLNGQYVAPGVYMDSAVIKNGSIGYAKIGTAEIDTLLIKGEAITVPSSLDYSYGQIARGGYTNVATLYVNFGEQPPARVVVMCFANFWTTGGNTGGATLGLWVENINTGKVIPAAGVYTPNSITVAAIGTMTGISAWTQGFRVWASHAGFGWDFLIGSGNLTVIGIKR